MKDKITIRRDPVCNIYCKEGHHKLEIEINETNVFTRKRKITREIDYDSDFSVKPHFMSICSYISTKKYTYMTGLYNQKYINCPLDGYKINIGKPVLIKELRRWTKIEKDEDYGD